MAGRRSPVSADRAGAKRDARRAERARRLVEIAGITPREPENALAAALRLARDAQAARDAAGQCDALLAASRAAEFLGRYADSLASTAEALRLAGALRDPDRMRACELGAGTCNVRLGRYDRARAHFERVIKLSGSPGAEVALGRGCFNLGNVHFYQDRLDEAEACYRRALAILNAHFPGAPREALIQSALGNLLARRERWAEAIRCQRRSLAIHARHDNWIGQGEARINLAETFRVRGRLKAALTELKLVMEIGRRTRGGNLRLIATINLGQCFEDLGEPGKALECYGKALKMMARTGEIQHREFVAGRVAALSGGV